MAGAAYAGTFGTVVPIGGQASDLALDEARGVVYVANYTANRIDVISIATKKIQTSINVAAQPSSLALSPSGRFLVITHLSNFKSPLTPNNGLTVMDLTAGVRRTFTFGSAPMGVAFGYDGLAVVATSTDLLLLDPATGSTRTVTTMNDLIKPKELPVPAPTGPREIIRASMTASGDQYCIWGTIEAEGAQDKQLIFRYEPMYKTVNGAVWISSPTGGPRVVSTNKTGSNMLTGWGLYHARGFLLAEFPDPLGKFGIGSHAIDSDRNIIYAQVPNSNWTQTTPPVLQIVDADNLAVREKIRLKENLSGRSVLNAARDVMYSVSESGLTILPVGTLNQAPRVVARQEDVVFRGQWCDRRVLVQELELVDPGGNKTDFNVTPNIAGVTVEPASGFTPAKVKVSIDMNAFQANKGTLDGLLDVSSGAAVNVPKPVRVLINNREPDQRGTFFNVPGKLVDLAADPKRNRFYVLRQDTNQVLVFDANNYKQVGTLRTGNTPWSMALTSDRKYLVVGADDSQVAHVYNLDTLQPYGFIIFPFGHYPRWIASSGRAMLAAARVAGPKHKIDQIQFIDSIATELPSLGVWENDIDVNTALAASPGGGSILVAQANGTVMLYDANADTFVAARQDVKQLSGTVAALSDSTFIVDNMVLNASLVPVQMLETGSGLSSGFAAADNMGLRTTAPSSASPGVIQRIDLAAAASVRPTRMTEAPVLASTLAGAAFTRSLAALPNKNAIISLSTSGFTVLPWNYDAAVAAPQIDSIASAADQSSAVAPGGLFTITGSNLSPVNAATNEIPLPTALGDSCMTINGALVPMVFVSPSEINGQIPFTVEGTSTMILRTPAGVSNSFKFEVEAQAPSVFQADFPGLDNRVATVVRAANNEPVTPANPIHPDDWIIVYATGLGAVTPEVKSGDAGPTDPLAKALTQPTLTLGALDIPVAYAGLAPGQVGVYQINAKVPFKHVPDGMSVPLTIKQGDVSTTVNVRVVKP